MRFLKIKQVLEMTAKCKTSVYKAISEGTFPKPVHVGEKRVAWIEQEILEWMSGRIRERDTQ